MSHIEFDAIVQTTSDKERTITYVVMQGVLALSFIISVKTECTYVALVIFLMICLSSPRVIGYDGVDAKAEKMSMRIKSAFGMTGSFHTEKMIFLLEENRLIWNGTVLEYKNVNLYISSDGLSEFIYKKNSCKQSQSKIFYGPSDKLEILKRQISEHKKSHGS